MSAVNIASIVGYLLVGTAGTGSCRPAYSNQANSLSLQKNIQQQDIFLSLQHVQVNSGSRRMFTADDGANQQAGLYSGSGAYGDAPWMGAYSPLTNAREEEGLEPVDVEVVPPEPEDLILQGDGNCSTVLQAIQLEFPEFAELITNVLPNVTPKTTLDKFSDPHAAITVLMPPRDSVRGVQYSYKKGDMSSHDVRDIVLVHVLDQKLTFQDLVNLPEDTLVDTLLVGSALKPSLAGAISGSKAGEPGSGSVGLMDVDLDVCTDTSTMHTLKSLLIPDDLILPVSAAPRTINQTEASV